MHPILNHDKMAVCSIKKQYVESTRVQLQYVYVSDIKGSRCYCCRQRNSNIKSMSKVELSISTLRTERYANLHIHVQQLKQNDFVNSIGNSTATSKRRSQ